MNSNNEQQSKMPESNDKELKDLLESTFNDFCSIYSKDRTETDGRDQTSAGDTVEVDNKQENNPPQPFISLFDSDSELKHDWSQLIQSCKEPVGDEDLQNTLFKTLNKIADKAKDIPGADDMFSEDEMAKILANLADADAPSDNSADNPFELGKIMPLMSNIMENLLSKDFLYPTLSDLKDKYPTYLKENKNTLSKDDFTRFENQLQIINEICVEFEAESPENESTEVKNNRFSKILGLMQKMQSYGSPPEALVSSNPDAINELNSLTSGAPEKCTVM